MSDFMEGKIRDDPDNGQARRLDHELAEAWEDGEQWLFECSNPPYYRSTLQQLRRFLLAGATAIDGADIIAEYQITVASEADQEEFD